MDFRFTIFFSLLILAVASALPEQYNTDIQARLRERTDIEAHMRARRDVLESIRGAWDEVVRTLTNAGENVVQVFRPTEKSTVDKIVDEVKTFTQG